MTPQQAAIQAAQRWGCYVFPIRPFHKSPRGWVDWPNRNSNDPAFLAARWPSPQHNYGIACKRSGLVVLDLDVDGPDDIEQHHGVPAGARVLAEQCSEHGQGWPDTLTIATPRGGWHLIFRAIPGRPVGNHAGTVLGAHIDIRGGKDNGGGYIVGPGSVIDERAYDGKPVRLINGGRYVPQEDRPIALLPEWLASLLDPPQDSAEQCRHEGANAYSGGPVWPRVRGLIQTVLDAPQGQRNSCLHWAACRAAELVTAGEANQQAITAALAQAGENIGLPAREVRNTIASAMRTGAVA